MNHRVLIPVVLAVLTYFLSAFVAMDFNPNNWQLSGRIVICFLWLLFSAIAVAMYDDLND